MPQSILELIFKTSKSGQGGKQAASELKELKAGVGELSSGLLGVNVASVGVIGVITAIGAEMSAATKETIAYANEVRDLSRISGASVEDTSRLIQTADDLKISYETLTAMTKKFRENGLVLTTEELAKASDKYLALQTQQERNTFAEKTLGKAWQEGTKILEAGGDALRKMAAGQSANLVLTQKQVDAARKLEIAQDGLDDSLQGIEYTLGNAVIPIVTDFLTLITDTLFISDKLSAQLAESTDNYQDYSQGVVKATQEEIKQNAIIQTLGVLFPQLTAGIAASTVATTALTEQQYKLKNGLYDVTDEIDGRLAADKRWAEYSKNQTQVELSNMRLALDNEQDAWSDTSGAMEAYQKSMVTTNLELGSANTLMQEYTTQLLYNNAAAGLGKEASILLATSLGLVDQNTLMAMNELEKLRAGMVPGEAGARAYAQAVAELNNKISMLKDKTVSVTVNTFYHGAGTVAPSPAEIAAQGHASGGSYSYTIPAGFNENFPISPGHVGSSGERVDTTVTPAGRSSRGGTPLVGVVNLYNGMDLASFERMLMKATRK